MHFQTRKILLSAGAAAALAFAAQPALAHDHGCVDDACAVQTLFEAADAPAAGVGATSLASPKYGTWGFDLSGIDRSVRPGDDFFKFANGKWSERTEIPSDQTRYGAFNILRDLSQARVHAILEDAAAGKLSDPDAAKIGAGYAAFMDEALAEKLDAKPIAPELAQIRRVKTRDEFTALMGKANTTGFTSILPVFISIDAKAPTRYAVMSATGGLGLPDRDYYLQPNFAEKKARYQAYIQQILTLVGWEKPAENARPSSTSKPRSPA